MYREGTVFTIFFSLTKKKKDYNFLFYKRFTNSGEKEKSRINCKAIIIHRKATDIDSNLKSNHSYNQGKKDKSFYNISPM